MPTTSTGIVFHCVICGDAIAPERVTRKAVTCSEAHARDLKNERRKLRDMTRCRNCNRPSTPEERRLFTLWRNEYNKAHGVKRGWKKGNKPGPRKKPAAAELEPKHAGGASPLEVHLGIIEA
jgi:predicted nucleic acid-binding Zn ribbon protein